MKIAIYMLMALVAWSFIKGGLDIHHAIDAGESPRSVAFGAMPMFLIGAFAIMWLGKVLVQMDEADKQEPEDTDS